MKDSSYTNLVCASCCSFYKPGKKEEMLCGGYKFLKHHLCVSELEALISNALKKTYLRKTDEDRWIREHICSKCDFLVDGCDFIEGLPSPPCGGCIIIFRLIS
ncbi:MAG: hypothetical protein JXR79_09095 [Nitrospirae bacterium]|nr:hypothetical protein [Nitrospirota bacterium]